MIIVGFFTASSSIGLFYTSINFKTELGRILTRPLTKIQERLMMVEKSESFRRDGQGRKLIDLLFSYIEQPVNGFARLVKAEAFLKIIELDSRGD